MVHMVNARHLGVARHRHGIKTHRSHLLEGGLQRCQALHRGVRFDEFVFAQNDLLCPIFHGNNRALEIALRAGVRCALLRLQRKGVHIRARETLQRGDQVRTNALRHE